MSDKQPLTEAYHIMVRRLAKPGAAIITGLTPQLAHLLHMAIGIAGEANEAELAMADLLVCADDLDGRIGESQELHSYRQAALLELGDLEFYIQGLIDVYPLQAERFLKAENDVKLPDDLTATLNLLPRERESLFEAMILVRLTGCDTLERMKKTAIYGKAVSVDGMLDQIFVMRAAMLRVYKALGSNRAEVQRLNAEKLNRRYPDGYTNEAAIERKDSGMWP